ncbi:unnamed protein product [Heligmosomoides polygyrus]|uniref:Endo/exonuclease/phosphatase domain-containing protein n=1 Tax=Heligmosomoides polygyrus TaxID=6339 RepID=A0A183G9E3_HELPZ|nr:unnamed protein product [Heligmosomoides polygyrus]
MKTSAETETEMPDASFMMVPPILVAVFSPKTPTRFGTWNIRTLFQTGRLARQLREFEGYRLDILEVSEMRWTGNDRIISSGKSIIFSGGSLHTNAAGFVLSQRASNALVSWKPVNDRIISARFRTKHIRVTVVQVYAPTEDSEDAEKDEFYECLQQTIDKTPRRDLKIAMGDFNAKLGGDQAGLEKNVGPFTSASEQMKMEVDSSPFAATTISALATLISDAVGYTRLRGRRQMEER